MYVAIDPASTTTGLALFDDEQILEIIEIVGPGGSRRSSNDRIRSISVELCGYLFDHPEIELAVIEVPEGQRRGRAGGQSHNAVAVAAFATGFYAASLWNIAERPFALVTVRPSEWTKRRTKQTRIMEASMILDCYEPDRSSWTDGLDAAALALWWMDLEDETRQRRTAEATRAIRGAILRNLPIRTNLP